MEITISEAPAPSFSLTVAGSIATDEASDSGCPEKLSSPPSHHPPLLLLCFSQTHSGETAAMLPPVLVERELTVLVGD